MTSFGANHSAATAFEAWAPDGTCYTRVSIDGHTLGVQLEPAVHQLTGQQVAERLIACNDVAYLKGRLATRKLIENDPHLRSLDGLETQADLDHATRRLHRYAPTTDPPARAAVYSPTALPALAQPATRTAEIFASLDDRTKVAFCGKELAELHSGLDGLIRNVSRIERTATDPDAVLAVTLGCDGRLIGLWIHKYAPYRFSHLTLETKLNATMRDALDEVHTAWKKMAHTSVS